MGNSKRRKRHIDVPQLPKPQAVNAIVPDTVLVHQSKSKTQVPSPISSLNGLGQSCPVQVQVES